MRRSGSSPLGRVLALAACSAVVFFVASACGDDSAEKRRQAKLAEGCTINSDCSSPLVCAFKRCHVECQTSRDCEQDQLCIAADKPFFVCQLGDERECDYNSQCPGSQVCAVDGKCRDQCAADRDCVPEQVCRQGTCAELYELVDDKLPTVPSKADGGQPCIYNSQCEDPLVCIAGVCRIECLATKDCPLGQVCVASRCGPPGITKPPGAPPEYGQPCTLQSDCPSTLVCKNDVCLYECNTAQDCTIGTCCFSHKCVTGAVCDNLDGGAPDSSFEGGAPCSSNVDCDDKLWCNGQEVCTQGKCAPALDTPCNSHSSCIKDTCTEATKTCSSVTLAPQDLDKDGHLDLVCGGADCDDSDPKSYPGAPELCDGTDNDCNGKVDDNSRQVFGPKLSAPVDAAVKAMTVRSGAAVAKGSMFLAFATTTTNTSSVSTLYGEALSATGVALGAPKTLMSSVSEVLTIQGAESGSGTALILVLATYNSFTAAQWLVLVKDDLTPITSFKMGSWNGHPDVTWTGSDYLVAWPLAGTEGHLFHVDATGQVTGDTVFATGILTKTRTSVAVSGGKYGVAYVVAGPQIMLSVHGASGSVLLGPKAVATGSPVALAGTSNGGFLLAYVEAAITKVVHIDAQGNTGTPVSITSAPGVADQFDGATDGAGALFAMSRGGSGPYFIYGAASLTEPLEIGLALNPIGFPGMVNLSGSPGSFVLSHFDATSFTTRFTRVGCP